MLSIKITKLQKGTSGGKPGIDGRIILKWALKRIGVKVLLNSCGSGYNPMVNSC
jgi:hypothetical protein